MAGASSKCKKWFFKFFLSSMKFFWVIARKTFSKRYFMVTSCRFIYQLAKLISQKWNVCFSESKSWLNSKLSNLVARLTILCIRGSRKIRPLNTEDISIAVSNAQICWRNLYKPKLWMQTLHIFFFFHFIFCCWFYTCCCSYMYKG